MKGNNGFRSLRSFSIIFFNVDGWSKVNIGEFFDSNEVKGWFRFFCRILLRFGFVLFKI